MSLMSKDMWNKEWEAMAKAKRDALLDAEKARRDAERWDNEVMNTPDLKMLPSGDDVVLPSPDDQRIPALLFDSYGVMPTGWVKSYSASVDCIEVMDPRGRVWVTDPSDRRFLVLAVRSAGWEKTQDATIQRVIREREAKRKDDEPPKHFDRFEGLDI